MSLLNRPAYSMEYDRLIYDNSHPIDGSAVAVAITSDTEGVIKRGQILDFTNGSYVIHMRDGEPSAIASEDVSYAADDTSVTVPVYISGAFARDAVIADPVLTAADVENLRSKGIFLK